jgi:hypothetical protein
MTKEERDELVRLKTEQDVLQDAIGIVIKVISDKIIANQMEITKIRGDSDVLQRRAEKLQRRAEREADAGDSNNS